MGSDKAFLEIGGQSLLARSIGLLSAVCHEVMIVGDRKKFSNYGKVIEDNFPGCGPLAGIHAALLHSSADLNLVIAVDMPFLSVRLLDFLLSSAEKSGAMVTVPRTRRGFEPLCAVYSRAFAVPAEQALRAGKYKIDALFRGLPMRVIEEDELRSAGFSADLFRNLNTPNDLRNL